ncbi:hypothetical protein NMG60_11035563 [Bertholletia excelsa]
MGSMDDNIDEQNNDSRDLYNALLVEDEDEVLHLCKMFPDGPLHEITIHGDTVLHVATYSKKGDLVLKLLTMVSKENPYKITIKNGVGNTILHEAATSDKLVGAAAEMISMAPELLDIENDFRETPVYRAARFRKFQMFKFLDDQVSKTRTTVAGEENVLEKMRAFYQKEETTVLHTAIVTEDFELALWIAQKYEYLVGERDRDQMTALQLLACNPSAFKARKGRWLKRLIYSCISIAGHTAEREVHWRLPIWEAIREEMERYESALKLAKFLVARDTSWKATRRVEDKNQLQGHEYSSSIEGASSMSTKEKDESQTEKLAPETPLFLATMHGCVEIAEEILKSYPWAVDHIDSKKRTILHAAIEYRQMDIFDMVEKMGISSRRLLRKLDINNNSILHMVGENKNNEMAQKIGSPALQLQDELLLFERVENLLPACFIKHLNKDGITAEKQFADRREKLHKEAKDWLKRTAEHCSLVAVLIATVAFAAAYTVPGGPNQNTGIPLLLNHSFFVIFTMTDVLSLTFAVTSVIVFLSILTSPFRLKDFKQSLPQKLMLGVTFLISSVSMMMLAFAATIILMINNNEQWAQIALYTASFLPVCIFALSYLPLYMALMKTLKYLLWKIAMFFPQYNGSFCLFSFFKSQATKSPHQRHPRSSSRESHLPV